MKMIIRRERKNCSCYTIESHSQNNNNEKEHKRWRKKLFIQISTEKKIFWQNKKLQTVNC